MNQHNPSSQSWHEYITGGAFRLVWRMSVALCITVLAFTLKAAAQENQDANPSVQATTTTDQGVEPVTDENADNGGHSHGSFGGGGSFPRGGLGGSERAHSEPARSEPARSEPARSERAHSEPARSESAHSEPAHSEPAHKESLHSNSDESINHSKPERTHATREEKGSNKVSNDKGQAGNRPSKSVNKSAVASLNKHPKGGEYKGSGKASRVTNPGKRNEPTKTKKTEISNKKTSIVNNSKKVDKTTVKTTIINKNKTVIKNVNVRYNDDFFGYYDSWYFMPYYGYNWYVSPYWFGWEYERPLIFTDEWLALSYGPVIWGFPNYGVIDWRNAVVIDNCSGPYQRSYVINYPRYGDYACVQVPTDPAIFVTNPNTADPYMTHIAVGSCPDGLVPTLSDWPRIGDYTCGAPQQAQAAPQQAEAPQTSDEMSDDSTPAPAPQQAAAPPSCSKETWGIGASKVTCSDSNNNEVCYTYSDPVGGKVESRGNTSICDEYNGNH